MWKRNSIYPLLLSSVKISIDELFKTVPGVSDHFSLLSVLYDFFKLSEIHKLYSDEALKRLIETRWSGHYQSIEAVFKEILQIIQCLEECQVNPSVKYGNKVKAEGHLKIVNNPYFVLLNKILFEVFSTLNIANYVLQGRDSNLTSTMQTIEECRVDIDDF